jgi:ribosomal protein L40E
MKWRPIDVEKAEYKAPKCRKCYAEWLVHERDERADCMVGVCQKCGARTQS